MTGKFPPNYGRSTQPSPTPRLRHSNNGAFSLVELMVVIGVISIMAVAAVTGVSSVNRGAQVGKAMSTLGGVMDFARQYAIANNTYTYVGFNEQTNANAAVAVFASKTGRRLFGTTSTPVSSYDLDTATGASNVVLATPSRDLSQITVASNAGTYGGWAPPAPPATAVSLNQSWSLTTQKKKYVNIVGFTPAGAAIVANDGKLSEVIEFGILPPSGNGYQGFAVRLSGLTGLNKLIQP